MKFYSFWAINAPLADQTLIDQLHRFRELGFDGVVLQPRFYQPPPEYLSPAWMETLQHLCTPAAGMDIYIQDENGWPAPSADGKLLLGHPELRQSWIAAYPQGEAPADAEVVHADGDCVYAREWGTYADTMNPEVARRFITLTYEPYKALFRSCRCAVRGLFCDEPQFGPLDDGSGEFAGAPFGTIPWTGDLSQVYGERYGEDLVSQLPALFHDLPESPVVRVRFYELAAEIFRERFINPLVGWCESHGVRWTGHYKGEENPYFQLWFSGPCAPLYRMMGHAGIDSLERYPGERYFVREAASVIRQQQSHGIAECLGGGGWGMAAGDMWAYLNWLGMHGFDRFVLHQAQYQFTPMAIHDWPPSVPFHQPYAECLPAMLGQLRANLSSIKAEHAVHPLLVVIPYRGLMGRLLPAERTEMDIHKASRYADSAAGALNTQTLNLLRRLDTALIGYDVISEAEFESLARADGGLAVGACQYDGVVVSAGCVLGEVGEGLLAAAANAGVYAADLRKASANLVLEDLRDCLQLPIHAIDMPMPAKVAGELYRENEGYRLALINTSGDEAAEVALTVAKGLYVDGAEVDVARQCVTLLPGEVRLAELRKRPVPAHHGIAVSWNPTAELADANILVLDHWQHDRDAWTAVLTVEEGVAPLTLVSLVPLAEICLDGVPVAVQADGAFRYPEMRQYRLPSPIAPGTHTLRVDLESPWTDPTPFRLWVAGDFGVRSSEGWAPGLRQTLMAAGGFSLVSAPGEIDGEKLVESGYPFYTGTVRYTGTLTLPRDRAVRALRLASVQGAAARVLLDGKELGWTWGPRWEVTFDDRLPAGEHQLTVELATTSFNLFGPHHHALGDPPVVTTSHYTGVRDFAQPPELPEVLVEAYHVQPTGLGKTVELMLEDDHVG
ncbi:MAG: hypothetical protein ACYDBB_13970 [Armatimonadota bacterium]